MTGDDSVTWIAITLLTVVFVGLAANIIFTGVFDWTPDPASEECAQRYSDIQFIETYYDPAPENWTDMKAGAPNLWCIADNGSEYVKRCFGGCGSDLRWRDHGYK